MLNPTRDHRLPRSTELVLYVELKKLKKHMRPHMNDHELADLLIDSCVESGCNTGPKILDMLVRLDFNQGHIGLRLRHGTGTNPARHHWWKDEKDLYHRWVTPSDTSGIVVPPPRPSPPPPPPLPRVSAKHVHVDDGDPPF